MVPFHFPQYYMSKTKIEKSVGAALEAAAEKRSWEPWFEAAEQRCVFHWSMLEINIPGVKYSFQFLGAAEAGLLSWKAYFIPTVITLRKTKNTEIRPAAGGLTAQASARLKNYSEEVVLKYLLKGW